MNIRNHTEKRLRQRGGDMSIILKYGEKCQSVFLLTSRWVKKTIVQLRRWLTKHASPQVQKRARSVRHLISQIERRINLVMGRPPELGEVIMLYFANGKRQRKFLRGDIRHISKTTSWRKV